jgi:hypothetical protein
MAKRKLTLTVDEAVIARAHAYGVARGTSVSQLVNDYLDRLSRVSEPPAEAYAPRVARLLGVLPPSTLLDDYRAHLDAKYGRGDE